MNEDTKMDPTKHHAILDCPECDTPCRPYKENKNGSAYYVCIATEYHGNNSDLRFQIDADGELHY